MPYLLLVVLLGIGANVLYKFFFSFLQLSGDHLVILPVAGTMQEFASLFTLPDSSQIGNDTYSIGLYKLSLHITSDDKLAQQVLENSFVFIWKNIDTYTPSQISFGVWLISIVKQEAIKMAHLQVND